jgi:predicted ArsR family transcriptional regulator
MTENVVSISKKRILGLLKKGGERTAAMLAHELGLTDVAIRQHLLALEAMDMVTQRVLPVEHSGSGRGRGRPATLWSLTEASQALFPERHAELTVGLIEAMRSALGEDALLKVIDTRADAQVNLYRDRLPPRSLPIKDRVEALARLRTEEGYMADVCMNEDGSLLLIEHHCPICDAAKSCVGLCGAELRVFQEALGPDVAVERTQHLLSGDSRCVYLVRVASAKLGQR